MRKESNNLMIQNHINERQNEELMLKYQFAARKCYNTAEILNYMVWILCIISALFVILSNDSILFQCIPFIVDISALFLGIILSNKVSKAATFRSYFDAYVLNINADSFSNEDIRKMKEKSVQIVQKDLRSYNIQSSNNGKSSPPGVREWYDVSPTLSLQEVQYECQRQNCWWNKKLVYKRYFITIPIAIFALTVTFLAFQNITSGKSVLTAVFGSSAIIIRCIERFQANKQYHTLSNRIDGALEALSESRSDKNISKLQDMLNERRAIPVIEFNLLHKHYAKYLSEIYHNIIS